jgi:hypothetical protein
MDIGRLRSLSPRHISIAVSDWTLQDFPASLTLAAILTSDGSSDNVDADRARTTTKEASDDQSCKIRRRSRWNEPDEEQDVCTEVARHAAGVLRQWHEKQREHCCAYVPGRGRPVKPWEVGLANTELRFHLDIT